MSIKLMVDNNFFDNYDQYRDEHDKGLAREAFTHKKLSFYPSIELLDELIRLYDTKRKHLLPKYSVLFLDMMRHKWLNDCVRKH